MVNLEASQGVVYGLILRAPRNCLGNCKIYHLLDVIGELARLYLDAPEPFAPPGFSEAITTAFNPFLGLSVALQYSKPNQFFQRGTCKARRRNLLKKFCREIQIVRPIASANYAPKVKIINDIMILIHERSVK